MYYFGNRCNIRITVHINGEISVVLRPIAVATLSLPCPICLWSLSFHPILHMQYKANTLYLSHKDASECPSSPQTWTLNEQENIRPTLSQNISKRRRISELPNKYMSLRNSVIIERKNIWTKFTKGNSLGSLWLNDERNSRKAVRWKFYDLRNERNTER